MAALDTLALAKTLARLEQLLDNPLVHGTLVNLLPSFGVSAEDLAEMNIHHAQYVQWEAEARARSRPPIAD